ncbi:hypothetical protein [Lutispora saccharofermentans]|nr:hypothetical protein [Lutispora saccharofermentans]
MKKLILVLVILSIIGLTPVYCFAEEENNKMLSIGTEESMF